MDLKKSLENAHAAYKKGELEQGLSAARELLSLPPKTWQEHQLQWQLQWETRALIAACLHKMGRTEEALSEQLSIVEACADVPEVHFSLSLYLLYAGDFDRGWKEYEWRHQVKRINTAILAGARWQGEDLTGKAILVLCEQGFGDCIHFARYLPLVKKRAGRLLLACFQPLIPLFQQEPCIDEVLDNVDENTSYDFYINICSLGKIFDARPGNIPPPEIFKQLSEAPKAKWKSRISDQGFNIGIAWSGNRGLEDDVHRTGEFRDFLRLLALPDVHLYTLQLHDPMPDLPSRVHQLGTEIETFEDTAAIISCLDIVISVDTVLVHLAATLGCETWVLLPTIEDWRWVNHTPDREDNDWYPNIRIFKQTQRRNWDEVFERIVESLRRRLQ